MRIEITDQVKHESNHAYQCVLVQFEEGDKHFFEDKQNWMPKSSEAFALCQVLYVLDPKFRGLLDKHFDIRGFKNE